LDFGSRSESFDTFFGNGIRNKNTKCCHGGQSLIGDHGAVQRQTCHEKKLLSWQRFRSLLSRKSPLAL
jgi:hypothetical protein